MPFDFKKEPLYRAGQRPQIVQVPPCSYLAVRGQGDPNQLQGSYQQAVSILYAVAYTLKMSPETAIPSRAFSTMSSLPWGLLVAGGSENFPQGQVGLSLDFGAASARFCPAGGF